MLRLGCIRKKKSICVKVQQMYDVKFGDLMAVSMFFPTEFLSFLVKLHITQDSTVLI